MTEEMDMEMDLTRRRIASIQQEIDELHRKSEEIRRQTEVALAKDKELNRQTAEVKARIAEIDQALNEGKPKRDFAEEVKRMVSEFEAYQSEALGNPDKLVLEVGRQSENMEEIIWSTQEKEQVTLKAGARK